MDGSNRECLTREILARSVAQAWGAALPEWSLSRIEMLEPGDDGERCLCGHCPIRELCYLRNRANGNEALVGNVCVKTFMAMDYEPVFAGVRRVRRDVDAAMNEAATRWAYAQRWISEWELNFLLDTMRKRRLSPKQAAKRAEINARILGRVRRRRGDGR